MTDQVGRGRRSTLSCYKPFKKKSQRGKVNRSSKTKVKTEGAVTDNLFGGGRRIINFFSKVLRLRPFVLLIGVS